MTISCSSCSMSSKAGHAQMLTSQACTALQKNKRKKTFHACGQRKSSGSELKTTWELHASVRGQENEYRSRLQREEAQRRRVEEELREFQASARSQGTRADSAQASREILETQIREMQNTNRRLQEDADARAESARRKITELETTSLSGTLPTKLPPILALGRIGTRNPLFQMLCVLTCRSLEVKYQSRRRRQNCSAASGTVGTRSLLAFWNLDTYTLTSEMISEIPC